MNFMQIEAQTYYTYLTILRGLSSVCGNPTIQYIICNDINDYIVNNYMA